jgi:protein-tyrosine phosphatase
MTPDHKTRICFICMGNICRSPLAENVLRHKARHRGVDDRFLIDSAGTGGWHAGEPPDPRVRRVASSHGVPMTGTARQVCRDDFARFDHLVCMDDENREHLLAMGAPPQKVRLLLECDRASGSGGGGGGAACREVPDPYYGGQDGFENVFRLVDSACDALLDELLAIKAASPSAPRRDTLRP